MLTHLGTQMPRTKNKSKASPAGTRSGAGKKSASSSSSSSSSSSGKHGKSQSGKSSADLEADPRFSHVGRDARFQRSKHADKKKKLVVDERFQKMFSDPAFSVPGTRCLLRVCVACVLLVRCPLTATLFAAALLWVLACCAVLARPRPTHAARARARSLRASSHFALLLHPSQTGKTAR
jgi:hypothetical protein